MNRLIGPCCIATLLTLSVTTSSFTYDSPRKYGIQLGGGFGMYNMGDIDLGTDYLLGLRSGNKATTADGGPMGNMAVITVRRATSCGKLVSIRYLTSKTSWKTRAVTRRVKS